MSWRQTVSFQTKFLTTEGTNSTFTWENFLRDTLQSEPEVSDTDIAKWSANLRKEGFSEKHLPFLYLRMRQPSCS
jgi:hypothetical protein